MCEVEWGEGVSDVRWNGEGVSDVRWNGGV